MREIAKTFAKLRTHSEGALIAYVTAGDPEPSCTPQIVEALVRGGADIVELGIPFSDPIADGPTIQAATVRALQAGTTPRIVLEMAEGIKDATKVPVVLLTYYNPVFRMGLKRFFETANASGIDGIVVPDLPVEEAAEYKEAAEAHDVDTIFLATPSTSSSRLTKIVNFTSGFLYLVTVYGVTGARDNMQETAMRLIRKTRQFTQQSGLPLAVGFGVSQPQHVRAIVDNGADGAIVGSGFVKIVEQHQQQKTKMLNVLEKYTSELKQATKKGDKTRNGAIIKGFGLNEA